MFKFCAKFFVAKKRKSDILGEFVIIQQDFFVLRIGVEIMRYTFIGKGLDLTENFQNKIMAKLNRISKLIPEDAEAVVKLSVIKLDNTAEVTVKLPRQRILRAEVTTNDMMASIDEIVDILESQMVKYKSRLKDKAKSNPGFFEELNVFGSDDVEDESIDIIRTKRFTVKPMDAEEAVMEMELLGHNFFVFRSAETDDVAVVYKRKDGKYGLIEPEF